MSLDHLQLLRSVGQFDNVAAGARLPFSKLTLLYAENGRGKTTLAAIFRSAAINDPQLVNDRRRLGSAVTPHIVIGRQAGPVVFQNGAWAATVPEIVVFDDAFVAANVCSGIEIDPAHRQNLHEFILGAQGVALNGALQAQVARIEHHNQALRAREWVLSPSYRAAISAIVAVRKKAGLTQRDLAKALGKPPSWVAKVEQRERRLDVVEFVAVARALGVKETDLLRAIAADLPKRIEI